MAVCRRVSWWFIAILALSAVRGEAAASLTLVWDASGDARVTGYVVHVGTAPGMYTQHLDVRDWSTSATFSWTPTTANAYCVTVWGRNAESTTTTYDSYASMAFAIR